MIESFPLVLRIEIEIPLKGSGNPNIQAEIVHGVKIPLSSTEEADIYMSRFDSLVEQINRERQDSRVRKPVTNE